MNNNYKFFCNKDCIAFPCHKGIDKDRFNCLFCFCPLMSLGKECNGNFIILNNGMKDCSNCIYPHIPENYDNIMERIKEKGLCRYSDKLDR